MPLAGQEIRVGDVVGPWTSFTPSWVNLSVGNGSTAGRWRRIGDLLIHVRAMVTFGSTTSFSGSLGFTIPNSLLGEGSNLRQTLEVWGLDSAPTTQGFKGVAVLQAGGGANYDRFYGPTTSVGWNSTTPITWATGDIIHVQGWIETTT